MKISTPKIYNHVTSRLNKTIAPKNTPKIPNFCIPPAFEDADCVFSKRIETEYLLPKDYINQNAMHIDLLQSFEKGGGTKAVKTVLKESLADKTTNGRITLAATSIDDRTCPIGFYYKLGFRSIYDVQNEICQIWLKNGGSREQGPWVDYAYMYLPKENIKHCLNYPNKLNIIS